LKFIKRVVINDLGMPIVENVYDAELAESFKNLANEWINKSKPISEDSLSGFTVNQICMLF
jgi:hypothetical protein